MTPNILPSKTEVRDKEDLQKKNHSGITSSTAKDEKNSQSGYKARTKIEEWLGFQQELKWMNIAILTFLHLGTLHTLYTVNLFENMKTFVWAFFMLCLHAMGTTAGPHRLWTHRSYKANLPLRILILICYATAGMNTIYDWVRDHRIHHKYVDTDADPHNSSRGFFFSHVGWLMMKKHPEVIRRGREVDMSDVLADPVVAFDDKHYAILRLIFTVMIPVMVPVYGWNETWMRSFQIQMFIRYVIGLNGIWSVNSAAHMWGSKPYDTRINPTNNKLVIFLAFGEGYHNYHHVFPWDYKADEFGSNMQNLTTYMIDFFAKIGWAYDLKQPSKEQVISVMMKRGDGSRRPRNWDPVAHLDSKIER